MFAIVFVNPLVALSTVGFLACLIRRTPAVAAAPKEAGFAFVFMSEGPGRYLKCALRQAPCARAATPGGSVWRKCLSSACNRCVAGLAGDALRMTVARCGSSEGCIYYSDYGA